jgi:hypothetical protein
MGVILFPGWGWTRTYADYNLRGNAGAVNHNAATQRADANTMNGANGNGISQS